MSARSRLGTAVLAIAATLMLCALAWAQGERPSGPPGGAPGGSAPGGFGFGGMRPPSFGGFGGSSGFGMFGSRSTSVAGQYSRLLGMATVQKELNLSEEQKAKIQEISEKDSAARREMFTGLRDVGETERQAAMEQLGKKMQAQRDESRKAMEAVLLPEQRTRLRQIALQVTGFDAIYDEEVQRELGLTELTAAVIRSINRRSGDKIRSSFKPGGDPQTAMAKVEEIRKETEQQVLSVLTDAQKAALEQMKGTKLEIPDSELRGRSPFGSRGSRGSRGPGGEDRGLRGDHPRDENR